MFVIEILFERVFLLVLVRISKWCKKIIYLIIIRNYFMHTFGKKVQQNKQNQY